MTNEMKTEVFTFDDTNERQSMSGLQESTDPQLSPCIKDVVRKSVLGRRKTRGEPDIKVEFSKPRKYELTEEEKRKKERRTMQNREAARRCRRKKKLNGNTPDNELNKHQAVNAHLNNEVQNLKSEVEMLKSVLSQHQSSGECSLNSHAPQQPEVPTHWQNPLPPDYGQCSSYQAMAPSPDSTSSTAANQLLMEETSFPDVTKFFQSPDFDPPMTVQPVVNVNRLPLRQEPRDLYPSSSSFNSGWTQNDEVNRVTPEMPQDDVTTLYSSRVIEQGQKLYYNEPIGIPSLDCIPFEELLTGNSIDFGQYMPAVESQLLH